MGRNLTYLALIPAQLVLLARNVRIDVLLELLPPRLDAARQPVQLLLRAAWDLGRQQRGRGEVHRHGQSFSHWLLFRQLPCQVTVTSRAPGRLRCSERLQVSGRRLGWGMCENTPIAAGQLSRLHVGAPAAAAAAAAAHALRAWCQKRTWRGETHPEKEVVNWRSPSLLWLLNAARSRLQFAVMGRIRCPVL
jgi:hypothetical protein